MKYIFGLGNPGRKYAGTRHNAGFEVVDELCTRFGIRLKTKPKLDVRCGEGLIGTARVMLAEPQTFMNVSGYAVAAVLDYYRAPLSDLMVIYDDVDLPFGTIRIREKGSAGTHNGMKSVASYLDSQNFLRVRLGIGSPEGNMPLASYVLSKFENTEELRELVSRAADAVICILEHGIQEAQQRYQGKKQGNE